MKSILKPGIIFLAIAISFVLSSTSFWLPKTAAVDAPKDLFSSSRAMEHIEKIAVNPHPIGSEENHKVRDYIVDDLEKLGLKPELQKTYIENEIWGEVASGNIENISCILEGTDNNNEAILMVAHYDSTPNGPGAADDAASVAALLETIRAIKESSPLKKDVIFLFTDGEEVGLLGAKAFADQNPLFQKVGLVMNFEARGNTGPYIMFETGDRNGWFMKEFKKAVPYPVTYSFGYDIYKRMPNDTDFTIFKESGKSGFNFASIVGFETYHNKFDNPENLNQRTLQHQGSYSLSLARHFGDLSLANRESSNAVYFTIMKSVLIMYSENWAIPLALLGCILFAAAFIIGLNKKIISLKGTILGFFVSPLMIAASVIVGTGIERVFEQVYSGGKHRVSPEELVTIIRHSNVWIIAMIILTIIMIGVLYRLINKWISYQNLLYGSLTLWIILAVISSILFKASSYMFALPVIIVLAGILAQLLIKPENENSYKHFMPFILAAVPCILIYTPVVFMVFESMTITIAGVLMGIVCLTLCIIIPTVYMVIEKTEKVEGKEVVESSSYTKMKFES